MNIENLNMPNKKISFLLIIFITGIVCGIYFNSNKGNVNKTYGIEYGKKINISDIDDEIKENEKIILNLEKEIKDLENYNINKVKENTLKFKKISGNTDLSGPGIEIELKDSEDPLLSSTEFGIIHDVDILNIINLLNISGAEAIAINDERYVNGTNIQCGGTIILVNNKSKQTPYNIKAIGDIDIFLKNLYGENKYLKILEEIYKIKIKIERKDKIYIKALEK